MKQRILDKCNSHLWIVPTEEEEDVSCAELSWNRRVQLLATTPETLGDHLKWKVLKWNEEAFLRLRWQRSGRDQEEISRDSAQPSLRNQAMGDGIVVSSDNLCTYSPWASHPLFPFFFPMREGWFWYFLSFPSALCLTSTQLHTLGSLCRCCPARAEHSFCTRAFVLGPKAPYICAQQKSVDSSLISVCHLKPLSLERQDLTFWLRPSLCFHSYTSLLTENTWCQQSPPSLYTQSGFCVIFQVLNSTVFFLADFLLVGYFMYLNVYYS